MIYFDDMKVGDAREFGPYLMTREEIVEFASKYDPQPFHLEEEAARRSPFGGLIASGWHTASVVHRLLTQGYLNQSASQGSPGIEQLRWLLPVRPGDAITVRFEVVELTPSTTKPRGTVHMKYEVFNQRREVVMTMSARGLLGRRPG